MLTADLTILPSVGATRAKLLADELGIRTLSDLLTHYPFRYIDRIRVYAIGEVPVDGAALVQFRGRVEGVSYAGEGRKRRFTVRVSDATGEADLVWFAGAVAWVEKRVEVGREYLIFGRPSVFQHRLQMVHPELESWPVVRPPAPLQGVYPSTEKLNKVLGANGFRRMMEAAWPLVQGRIVDPLPEQIRTRYGLMGAREALHGVHFPASAQEAEQARRRLKFDEWLGIQLTVQGRRTERLRRADGFVFPRVGALFNEFFREKIPFELTGAQKRVVKEIHADMVSGWQMNRLLQGDVGSGKTLVALLAMLLSVDNGFQACLMAPTEILARQHYATLVNMLDGLAVRVEVLTGATRTKERREILESLASGRVHIIIGTHALLEDRVRFANLGLVVIDEQHRFGVEQRARLWAKNTRPPHILVMTATPIPRTLAMTLYGDLEVSVIDELPPGRQPIRTVRYTDAARLRLQGFMKEQIALGRQIYVVYPLIHESEGQDYKDLEDGYASISRDFPLPDYVTAICHGRMRPEDKEESMRQFKSGQAQILVSTTVIEVGVDVPNASVMVIESAERFGLAQLHQLRGRVGRGAAQSYCVLMSGNKLSSDSRRRLEAMCETTDGFRLAELDLKLRGAGDVNGTLQSGMPLDLKIASPATDTELLALTRQAAADVLASDPLLTSHPGLRELRDRFATREEKIDFSVIS